MAFHQNYSCGACFKGAILGETQGNSVLCLNDNKNCIGFCSCGQNDPKDFLKTEESMREPCSGKDNAKYLQGWWMWALLPSQPPTDTVSWFPTMAWRDGIHRKPQLCSGRAQELEGKDICVATAHPTAQHCLPFSVGDVSTRRKIPAVSRSWIFAASFCTKAAREGLCFRTAQVCLDPFSASFCTKGKKYLFTHTQEPGWATRLRPLETQRDLWAVKLGRNKKPYKNPTKTPLLCHCPVQNHVDELRNELGAVSRSSHRGNALLVWPQSSATSHQPCAVSKLLPRKLWIMTRTGNSVLFIPCLFKLRK